MLQCLMLLHLSFKERSEWTLPLSQIRYDSDTVDISARPSSSCLSRDWSTSSGNEAVTTVTTAFVDGIFDFVLPSLGVH